jgi:Uma2 family endonuclease
MAAIPLPREPEIDYPESDGKPAAESEIHLDVMGALLQGLRDHFSSRPDIYVSANLLLYYEEGNPGSVVAPDLFVVRGVPNHKRRNYLLWREGKAPCFVLEITSKSTRDEDLSKKKLVYARLGVEEYFLFDPRSEYLEPQLQGFRLSRGKYQPIAPAGDGSLVSRSLGVSFRPDGESLRPVDVATGRQLLSFQDLKARLQKVEDSRRDAEERAIEAEARARQLAEELERLRKRSE